MLDLISRSRVAIATLVCLLMGPSISSAAWPPGSLLHPVPQPRAEIVSQYKTLPIEDRNHVHLFLVNGIDPGNVCNFQGLNDYIAGLGFTNIYFGQMWDGVGYVTKIREVRQADPQARVVLIGYSAGANIVWRMAQTLEADNTKLDLLVYLAGDTMRNCEGARPANATKVINVRAWGLVFLAGGVIHGAKIDGCDNYDLGAVRHSCAPTNEFFLDLMARELYTVATSRPLATTPNIVPLARGAIGPQNPIMAGPYPPEQFVRGVNANAPAPLASSPPTSPNWVPVGQTIRPVLAR